MFQHNRRLQQFITSADQRIADAKMPQDLLDLIEESRIFNGNFQFDSRDYWLYFGIDMTALIISIIAFQKSDESFWLFLIFLSIFIGITLVIRYFKRRKSVDRLSADIYRRDLLFDNHLTIVDSPNFTQKALESRFQDFHRGNYSREIKEVIAGKNQTSLPFAYHYYQFHYVDEKEETRTDSDGKTTTQKSYTHYDRFGLIVDLKSIPNMTFNAALRIIESKSLFGMNKSDYAPASITFRKNFKVQTKDSLQAAKFFTPVMVETLESLLQGFKEIVIETNQAHELLLSFTNHDLLTGDRQHSLKETDLFLQEIEQITALDNLQYTLHMLTQMLQEIDHNF